MIDATVAQYAYLIDNSMDKHEHLALIEPHAVIEISAKDETGLDVLIENINTLLPLGPRYYPAEQVSETNLRFIAAEIIREQIIQLTTEEIPYTVAVEINRFKEKGDLTVIEAFIYVERDSQKGIIIGKKGSMIKQIGVNARPSLEQLLGTQVHLETRVKVLKNWRTNEQFMKRIGYDVSRGKDD